MKHIIHHLSGIISLYFLARSEVTTAVKINITAFWDVTSYPEDGGSRLPQKAGVYLSNYTARDPRKE
jgi:hypothetical protein